MTMFEGKPIPVSAARRTLDKLVTGQPQPETAFVREKGLQKLAEVNAWKEVVIDALVINHALKKEHETDPRQALLDLIKIETQMALDPVISKPAAELLAKVPLMRFPTMLRKMWNGSEVQKWLDERAAQKPMVHVGATSLAAAWERKTGKEVTPEVEEALRIGHEISSLHWQRSFADHVYVPCEEYARQAVKLDQLKRAGELLRKSAGFMGMPLSQESDQLQDEIEKFLEDCSK